MLGRGSCPGLPSRVFHSVSRLTATLWLGLKQNPVKKPLPAFRKTTGNWQQSTGNGESSRTAVQVLPNARSWLQRQRDARDWRHFRSCAHAPRRPHRTPFPRSRRGALFLAKVFFILAARFMIYTRSGIVLPREASACACSRNLLSIVLFCCTRLKSTRIQRNGASGKRSDLAAKDPGNAGLTGAPVFAGARRLVSSPRHSAHGTPVPPWPSTQGNHQPLSGSS